MKRSTIDVDELLTQSRNGNLTQDQLATLVAADLKSRATTSQSKSRRIDDEPAVPSQPVKPSVLFELSSLTQSIQSIQSIQSMTTFIGTNLPVNVLVARRRRCARVDASIRDVLFDANAPGDNDTPLALSNRLGAVVTGGTKVQLLDLVARRRVGKPWQSPHSARIERIVIVDAAARLLVSQDVDGVVVLARIAVDCRVRADSIVQFRELASTTTRIWHLDVGDGSSSLLAVCVDHCVKVFDLLTPNIRSKWTIKCHSLDAVAVASQRRLIVALRDDALPRTTVLRCFQLASATSTEPISAIVGDDITVLALYADHQQNVFALLFDNARRIVTVCGWRLAPTSLEPIEGYCQTITSAVPASSSSSSSSIAIAPPRGSSRLSAHQVSTVIGTHHINQLITYI